MKQIVMIAMMWFCFTGSSVAQNNQDMIGLVIDSTVVEKESSFAVIQSMIGSVVDSFIRVLLEADDLKTAQKKLLKTISNSKKPFPFKIFSISPSLNESYNIKFNYPNQIGFDFQTVDQSVMLGDLNVGSDLNIWGDFLINGQLIYVSVYITEYKNLSKKVSLWKVYVDSDGNRNEESIEIEGNREYSLIKIEEFQKNLNIFLNEIRLRGNYKRTNKISAFGFSRGTFAVLEKRKDICKRTNHDHVPTRFSLNDDGRDVWQHILVLGYWYRIDCHVSLLLCTFSFVL